MLPRMVHSWTFFPPKTGVRYVSAFNNFLGVVWAREDRPMINPEHIITYVLRNCQVYQM